MKRLAVSVFVIGLAIGLPARATDVPIILEGAKVPDYEASMSMAYDHAKSNPTSRTVLFHDGSSRVQDILREKISVTYGDLKSGGVLRVYGLASGRLEGMGVENLKAHDHYYKVRAIRPIGKTEVLAGETCAWHEVFRRPEREKFGPIYFSCITADGIEVGERVMSTSDLSLSVTSPNTIVRRRVDQSDVLPRAEWFDAAFWLTAAATEEGGGSARPDFVMTLEGRAGEQMTWKRHYPWNQQDIRELDGRRVIKIWNENTKQGIYFAASKGGVFKSLIATNPIDPRKPSGYFGFGLTPKVMIDRETVIGEDCQWFDMTPGMMDASHHQCMTKDDIALKIVNGSGWGGGSAYDAIALMRRAVSMEEIMPPAEVLEPGRWGFDVVGKQ